MTYLYYKSSTYTSNQKPNEKTIEQWRHLSEKKIDDLADVLDLIPGSGYVKKVFSNVKEKIHKSDFAQKYLIVDPKKTKKLSKVGEFIKKHTE